MDELTFVDTQRRVVYTAFIVAERGKRSTRRMWRVEVRAAAPESGLEPGGFVFQGWRSVPEIRSTFKGMFEGVRAFPPQTYPNCARDSMNLVDVRVAGQPVAMRILESLGPHPLNDDEFFYELYSQSEPTVVFMRGWYSRRAFAVAVRERFSTSIACRSGLDEFAARHTRHARHVRCASDERDDSGVSNVSPRSERRELTLPDYAPAERRRGAAVLVVARPPSNPRQLVWRLETRGVELRAQTFDARGVDARGAPFWRLHELTGSGRRFVFHDYFTLDELTGYANALDVADLAAPTWTRWPDMAVLRALVCDLRLNGRKIHCTFKRKEGPAPESDEVFYWNVQARRLPGSLCLLNGWRSEISLVRELRTFTHDVARPWHQPSAKPPGQAISSETCHLDDDD